MQKSLSETPSRLFSQAPSKPKSCAVILRSIGYVVPAKAQLPSGIIFILFFASESLDKSRRNICA